MASATNSRARKRPLRLDDLREPVRRALAQQPVPLLALRLPDLERIAWRSGKRAAQRVERLAAHAFAESAQRVLRTGDCTGHDTGSDVFVIVMTAPSREARMPAPMDCRSVLERVAESMTRESDMRIETGWTVLRSFDPQAGWQNQIAAALERGMRERERYEFFATVGHELRTPLTSIRGYLDTLLDAQIDPATARRFLETAQREALRMGRLLEGMFEFSLLDLSAEMLLGRSCDVGRQIERACEIVEPLAQARSITLARRAGEGVVADLDPDACLQLLVNLIENAIKYGRSGGSVGIVAQRTPDGIAVAVDDDGPGVAACEREAIFGLRARGSRAGVRPGAGIGLAIVKMIVERAGGEIRVGDSPRGGARFVAVLPARAESAVRAS